MTTQTISKIVSKLSRAEAELQIIIEEEEEVSEFACSDLRGVILLIRQIIRKIQPQGES